MYDGSAYMNKFFENSRSYPENYIVQPTCL